MRLIIGKPAAAAAVVSPTLGLYYGDVANQVTVRRALYCDADGDGGVSINDFNALAVNFGVASGKFWTGGDFDYDGGVGISDFNRLAVNFGQNLPAADRAEALMDLYAFAAANNDGPQFYALTGVPEPTALSMLAAAAALGLRLQRRCM